MARAMARLAEADHQSGGKRGTNGRVRGAPLLPRIEAVGQFGGREQGA